MREEKRIDLDVVRNRSAHTQGRIGAIVGHAGRPTTRRSGRTTAAIALARANGGCLVAATPVQARQIERQEPGLKVFSVDGLRRIGATSEPLVFDHYAYEMHLAAADDVIGAQSELIERLVEEVNDARDELREARRATTSLRVTLAKLEAVAEAGAKGRVLLRHVENLILNAGLHEGHYDDHRDGERHEDCSACRWSLTLNEIQSALATLEP